MSVLGFACVLLPHSCSRFELAMLSKRKLLTVTRSGDVLILKRSARELEQSMLNIKESVEG